MNKRTFIRESTSFLPGTLFYPRCLPHISIHDRHVVISFNSAVKTLARVMMKSAQPSFPRVKLYTTHRLKLYGIPSRSGGLLWNGSGWLRVTIHDRYHEVKARQLVPWCPLFLHLELPQSSKLLNSILSCMRIIVTHFVLLNLFHWFAI